MYRKIFTATAALVIAAGAFAAGAVARPVTHTVYVVHTVDQVQSFNDGWNTALYGDAPAAR